MAYFKNEHTLTQNQYKLFIPIGKKKTTQGNNTRVKKNTDTTRRTADDSHVLCVFKTMTSNQPDTGPALTQAQR